MKSKSYVKRSSISWYHIITVGVLGSILFTAAIWLLSSNLNSLRSSQNDNFAVIDLSGVWGRDSSMNSLHSWVYTCYCIKISISVCMNICIYTCTSLLCWIYKPATCIDWWQFFLIIIMFTTIRCTCYSIKN